MTLSVSPNLILTKGGAGLPCTSCLFDLGEASGMAGAGPCPLKRALLRRLAGTAPAGASGCAASCDAFTPGFCEAGPDPTWIETAEPGTRLS